MHEIISKYLSGNSVTMQLTDDGKIVFYVQKYDPETGAALPLEVAGVTTPDEIRAEIAMCNDKAATLQQFLTQENL